jgi:hypothetical protein
MGQFIVGVDTPKVIQEAAALAVVELMDDITTLSESKEHAVRRVVAVRQLPANLPLAAVVGEVADAAAMLGPWTRVVYDAKRSDTIVRAFRDAQRAGRFANYPMGVNVIQGEGIGEADGRAFIGQGELLRSLLEMVRTKGFRYEEDAEGVPDLITDAGRMQATLTKTGQLQVTTPDRVIALGLALYPRIHLGHRGRRFYVSGISEPFESFAAAQGRHGQRALA